VIEGTILPHIDHNGVATAPLTSAPTQGGTEVSLMLGKQGSGLRTIAQWLVLGAIIGAMLNSRDVQRYRNFRSV
jgi:hypothetical protein